VFVQRVYRYRLYPTRRQREALDAELRAGCDLYNAALEQRRWAWRSCQESIGYERQSAELSNLRAGGLLSNDTNFWSQQAILRQLDRAFAAFFRRLRRGEKPGYPRFKDYRRFRTLTWTMKGHAGGVAVTEHGRLHLQGIGCVKVRWHRAIPYDASFGEVKVTRSSDSRRWHVAFYVDLPDRAPRPATGEMAGIDLGVRRLITLSTGDQLSGPRAGRAMRPTVRRAARRVSRRKPGSRRRAKAAAQLARHRERERNRRRDAAHKLSHALVARFDLIAVEELRVRNMLRSARGTVEQPGRNVGTKSGLNREIADAGWAQFLSFLAYKAEEAGRRMVRVDPASTSRTCAACNAVNARSRRADRFRCTSCGERADADVNAARVILARALAQEGISRPGRGRQAQTPALAGVA
jgi:putative transposase